MSYTFNPFIGNLDNTGREESADILPTVTNYLSTSNVLISSLRVVNNLTIAGNISGNNLRTSFNQGSATGQYSFATGSGKALGDYSIAAGSDTVASGFYSHAEGSSTIARGNFSFTRGSGAYAYGSGSIAEGANTFATGTGSRAEGYYTVTGEWVSWNSYSSNVFTFTPSTSAKFNFATPGTILYSRVLHPTPGLPFSYYQLTVIQRSTQTGNITATGWGLGNVPDQLLAPAGIFNHAEGASTTASGSYSHAEGLYSQALEIGSHAEGYETTASGYASHAEGYETTASGYASHAEGYRASAAQDYTYAWSDGELGTLTENISTTRSGQYMVSASGGMFIPGRVGIGTDSIANALTVVGTISTSNHGNSNLWNQAFNNSTAYQNISSSFLLQGGNTLSQTLSVGTSDNQHLVLETNSVNRMTILSSGNVGINNITPNERLTVVGNISATGLIFGTLAVSSTNLTGTVSASGPFLIGSNVTPVTGNALQIRGGNVRIDGVDLSNVPNITAFDTDGQSLFDLRSASPSANYNLSIASSGINNFMKFFGGRDGDAKPFIVVKTGQPLRFASYSNFFNTGNNFTEYARVDTAAGNVCIGGGNSTVALSAAVLQLDSTTKGFLPPRMTTTQRNTISVPPTGLMVYNTTTSLINYYTGNTWVALATATA